MLPDDRAGASGAASTRKTPLRRVAELEKERVAWLAEREGYIARLRAVEADLAATRVALGEAEASALKAHAEAVSASSRAAAQEIQAHQLALVLQDREARLAACTCGQVVLPGPGLAGPSSAAPVPITVVEEGPGSPGPSPLDDTRHSQGGSYRSRGSSGASSPAGVSAPWRGGGETQLGSSSSTSSGTLAARLAAAATPTHAERVAGTAAVNNMAHGPSHFRERLPEREHHASPAPLPAPLNLPASVTLVRANTAAQPTKTPARLASSTRATARLPSASTVKASPVPASLAPPPPPAVLSPTGTGLSTVDASLATLAAQQAALEEALLVLQTQNEGLTMALQESLAREAAASARAAAATATVAARVHPPPPSSSSPASVASLPVTGRRSSSGSSAGVAASTRPLAATTGPMTMPPPLSSPPSFTSPVRSGQPAAPPSPIVPPLTTPPPLPTTQEASPTTAAPPSPSAAAPSPPSSSLSPSSYAGGSVPPIAEILSGCSTSLSSLQGMMEGLLAATAQLKANTPLR